MMTHKVRVMVKTDLLGKFPSLQHIYIYDLLGTTYLSGILVITNKIRYVARANMYHWLLYDLKISLHGLGPTKNMARNP